MDFFSFGSEIVALIVLFLSRGSLEIKSSALETILKKPVSGLSPKEVEKVNTKYVSREIDLCIFRQSWLGQLVLTAAISITGLIPFLSPNSPDTLLAIKITLFIYALFMIIASINWTKIRSVTTIKVLLYAMTTILVVALGAVKATTLVGASAPP